MKPIAGEVLFRVVRPGMLIRWPKKHPAVFVQEKAPAEPIDREAIENSDLAGASNQRGTLV